MCTTRSRYIALALVVILVGCTRTTRILDGSWNVVCEDVALKVCRGVAEAFVNNLARNHEAIRQESGGLITVSPAACPGLPDWADPGGCWRAIAPTTVTARACMLIARQKGSEAALAAFGQVGGDEFAGPAFAPKPGTGPC